MMLALAGGLMAIGTRLDEGSFGWGSLLCLLSVTGEAGWTGGAVGAGLLVGAGVWWRLKQPTFQVRLESLEGELTAYESRDEERAGRVLSAVQQALEARP